MCKAQTHGREGLTRLIEHDSAAHKELVGEAVLHANSVVLGVVAGVHELGSQVEVVLAALHGSKVYSDGKFGGEVCRLER